ncbi:hypothetical protein LAZ40_13790 [Cereibacter sphaeroides]|uniref:hypothetical protein n=1 Tax=Cereibacter sphaeroides TaxID=1063 RepID=UPI001F15F5AE|nr:hypothetical protein [Cereibacter sphaeroides]MCE6960093.1 hypothetical protein [Cereibacter sphaeroides]MCE6973177.1 hypothetical protein [Cereibacter sphaeroides]
MIPVRRIATTLGIPILVAMLGSACAPMDDQGYGRPGWGTYDPPPSDYWRDRDDRGRNDDWDRRNNEWDRRNNDWDRRTDDRDRRNDDRRDDAGRPELPDRCLTRTDDGRYVYGARCLDERGSVTLRRNLPDACMTRTRGEGYVYGAQCLYRYGYKH